MHPAPETLTGLLDELRSAGVQLWAEEGRIRFRAPAGALTEEHKALLREYRGEALALLEAEAAPTLTPDPAARHDPFPLTDVQGAYLVGRGPAYDYGGVACHAYAELRFDDLDPERLRTAWNTLVRRHDMLRAVVSPKATSGCCPKRPANP
ncbi:hypothetical protein ACFQXA_09960 [Nocardiopsis composta]